MSKSMSVTAKLFAAAMVVVFLGSTVMAAADSNEPNKAKRQMRERGQAMKDPVEQRMTAMTKNLDLTKEQQEKIKPILQDQMKQMQELRKDTSIAPEQKRAKMQEIMKEVNAKIEAQLTPEQQEKFKKQQEEMKARMERRHRQGPPEAGKHAPDGNSTK